MKRRLPVLMLLMGLGCSFSSGQPNAISSPLEKYIAFVRTHRLDPAAIEFAAACGLRLEGIRARYGFANDDAGTWHVVPDLAKAYDNFQMDNIGTEEVWKIGNQFVIEEWNVELDVGGFQRTLYCFDTDRKLKMIDSTNFQLPVDDGKPWGMHERWIRKADGRFTSVEPQRFIGADEKESPKPKLSKEDQDFAQTWGGIPPKAFDVVEMKLPSELFR
jgi:hypothetical protein